MAYIYKVRLYSEPGCQEPMSFDHDVSIRFQRFNKHQQDGPWLPDGGGSAIVPAGESVITLDEGGYLNIRCGANGNIEGYSASKLFLDEGLDYNKTYN